jgi:hypothetical protein
MDRTKAQIYSQLELHDHYDDSLDLERIDNDSFKIQGIEDGEGNQKIRFFAHGRLWESSDVTLNFTKQGFNQGLVGGHAEANSSYYLVWAFFNGTKQKFSGFGLTKKPIETCTGMSSGNKGAECTLTLPNSYSFTVGARVSVWTSDSDWNTGTITERTSTTIKAQLDNESYGANLSGTTPTVVQYNKFRPYNINSGDLVSDNFRMLFQNEIYNNSSGNLQMIYDPGTGFNVIAWWNQNFTSPVQILHPYYMVCSGEKVINPLSPFVGDTLEDLTTSSRFIRASTTSSTEQADALQLHGHELAYLDTEVFDAGDDTRAIIGNGATGTKNDRVMDMVANGGGTPRTASETRPINISMVPVMKIIP